MMMKIEALIKFGEKENSCRGINYIHPIILLHLSLIY